MSDHVFQAGVSFMIEAEVPVSIRIAHLVGHLGVNPQVLALADPVVAPI